MLHPAKVEVQGLLKVGSQSRGYNLSAAVVSRCLPTCFTDSFNLAWLEAGERHLKPTTAGDRPHTYRTHSAVRSSSSRCRAEQRLRGCALRN